MNKQRPDTVNTTGSIILWINRIREILANERAHFIIGLCTLMLAVFLFLAFLSFFFTGDADQSRLEHLPFSQLTDVKNSLQNWTGFVGAYLAEHFINSWVGISSFLICIYFGAVGLKLMRIKEFNLLSLFIYCTVLLFWGSLFFGFFFISGYKDSFIYLGGANGYHLSLVLKANIGSLGTFLLIVVSFLVILTMISKRTIDLIRELFLVRWPYIATLFTKKRGASPVVNRSEQLINPFQDVAMPPQPVAQEVIVEYTELNETENEALSIEPEIAEQVEVEEPVLPIETKQTSSYVLINNHEKEKEDNHWIAKQPNEQLHKQEPLQPNTSIKKEAEFTVKAGGNPEEEELVEAVKVEAYDPTLELSRYKFPTFDLLNKYDGSEKMVDMEEQTANKKRIEETLRNYGIEIQAITATVGPTITLYEIIPKQGVRIAKIRNLEDDIALSLAALGIRIIAPIPGKGTVGIEVPNKDPQIVSMHSIIASRKFQESRFELPIALGKTITNEIFMVDLAKMPHILVAGATGQGKSVGLNAIITSLLYKKHPAQLKLVLIDPKKVEFNIYSNIERHFLAKLPDSEDAIITDVTKVVSTLNSICKEMDERYDLLKAANTRNIKEYNAKFQARQLNPEKGHRYMPYIVVIVDEFGDLIMTAGREVELPIARIAQLARAVGIHMIIATQRPSTNIITGTIKANFPARIAFRVSSMIDSRTILDSPGANQLIGRGDLLFCQGSETTRVQCAFIDTPEVELVSNFIGEQQGYPTAFMLPEYLPEGSDSALDIDLKDRDQMFEEVARLVVASQQGSTSMIQRKFAIGYNRAGRIMDQLEAAGVVGPFEGSKARQVLVMDDVHLDQVLNNL